MENVSPSHIVEMELVEMVKLVQIAQKIVDDVKEELFVETVFVKEEKHIQIVQQIVQNALLNVGMVFARKMKLKFVLWTAGG